MNETENNDDDKHDLDWSAVPLAKARQIFEVGQTHLQAQLQTALAADARATSTAGLFVTLGSAILAAGLSHWQTKGSWSILGAALSAAALFLWAGARAAWAARPVEFYNPGTHPEKWFEAIESELPTLLGGQAEIDDRDIKRNERQLVKNANALKDAFALALLAPVIAFVVWGLIALFFE
jgi:hypothetical protein